MKVRIQTMLDCNTSSLLYTRLTISLRVLGHVNLTRKNGPGWKKNVVIDSEINVSFNVILKSIYLLKFLKSPANASILENCSTILVT